MRRILRVYWQDHISNAEVSRWTGINNIVDEVKRRRWSWLGHALRMDKSRLPHAALKWTPSGKRKRGRPLGIWRRTVDEEMREAGKTWNELSWLAQDCNVCRRFVGALCFDRSSTED